MGGKTLAHVSTRPWSDYTSADYSIDQWHKACLIHQHSGAPTSKNQCKMPVRTPDGVVNKYGVIAAAASLNGARTPINASSDEKIKAARALISLYATFNEKPPAGLTAMVKHSGVELSDFLEHHGVKGMKWGIRNKRQSRPTLGVTTDHKRVAELKKRRKPQLTNKQLKAVNDRLNLEQNFDRLNPDKVTRGRAKATAILATVGVGVTAYNTLNSPAGKAAINLGKKALSKKK